MADPSTIFAAIETTQKVVDSWINHGLNFANYGLSKRQMQLQENAFKWQKYYDENQTQIRVNDFAKAGLNPILASGSNGGSSVSGVSASPAQPTASPSDYAGNLISALVADKQIKNASNLADEKNTTDKDIASKKIESDERIAKDKNETDKEIAEIESTTSRINNESTNRTQSDIATANNEAQKAVREADAYLKKVQGDKIDWQNLYNLIFKYYDGDPTTMTAIVSDIRTKLSSLFPNYIVDQYDARIRDKIKKKIFSPKDSDEAW